MKVKSSFSLLIILLIFYGRCISQIPRNALANYINTPDSSYTWQSHEVTVIPNGSFYELTLTSQTWHNIVWKHRVTVYFPEKAKNSNTLVLILRHIYNRNADFASLKIVSDSTNTASAILYDIPNQPLFDGKEEDDLLTHTFSNFIKTGDETWPALFPMVKSVVRAMDAIQYLAGKEKKTPVDRFVITGHSKRGHTAWLTAAIDQRVTGIIPIAIDILNSSAQLPHHKEVFGEYSTPSKASTEFIKELDHPRAKRLIEMIDPYFYTEQLTMPKLIVSATNDQFFATDALNLYWDGLKGHKWILYLSNANHVSAYSDARVNATAFAFIRTIAKGGILPKINWEFNEIENKVYLRIVADSSAEKAVLWVTDSKGKDFRQARWSPKPMIEVNNRLRSGIANDTSSKIFEIEIQSQAKGFIAMYGEVEFTQDNCSFLLSTQTHIIGGK